MRATRVIAAFVAAVVAAAAIATIVSTQFVLAHIVELGVDVPLGVRLETTAHDLVGMGPLLGALIAVAFAIAMTAAAAIVRFGLPSWRAVAYPLAGATAVFVLLLALESALGMMPIAGARGAAGRIVFVLAGAAGGWLFSALLPRPDAVPVRCATADEQR
jgi:hypothetical protein